MTRILLLSALVASLLSAQDWARAKVDKSPRHREWVTVKYGNRKVETFVAYPEAKTNTPVILVIHEIFGHSDWVENVTDEFAAAGYIQGLASIRENGIYPETQQYVDAVIALRTRFGGP